MPARAGSGSDTFRDLRRPCFVGEEGGLADCQGSTPEDSRGKRKEPAQGVIDVRGGTCAKVSNSLVSKLNMCSQFANTICRDSEKVTDTTPIPPPDWEALIGQIAKEIMEEHTPARILQVRAKLYDLLTHCIPATIILKTLTFKLIPLIDDALKADVIYWSAFYEHRIKTGTKVIFHLEAFVAKFMRIFEMYLMSMDL